MLDREGDCAMENRPMIISVALLLLFCAMSVSAAVYTLTDGNGNAASSSSLSAGIGKQKVEERGEATLPEEAKSEPGEPVPAPKTTQTSPYPAKQEV